MRAPRGRRGSSAAGARWANIYWSEPTTSGVALFPVVTSSGRMLAKNDGFNGTITIGGNCAITVAFGIVTGHSGAGCP